MIEETKKFLDQKGVEYLWSKINMQDYPNNDTLVTIINAIDEGKMDKTTAIPLIEQAIAGQVPVVKSVDENGKPVEWEARELAPELIVPIIAYPDFGILVSEVNFQQVDNFALKNGLDNLRASFFIAGDTLETETEHYQPYYYSISCLKVRDIPDYQVIAYDFVFLMDDELKTYRLTSTGTTLHSSIKLPSLKSAEVGQALTVKEIDENGKPISWEAGKFIKTVNGKEPDGNGNIKIRTPYEVTLSHYEGLVTAFNRTPQQIIEAERSSDKEVIYKLYVPIVTEDSETGPDIYATEVELKNINENYSSYTGYQMVVKFGEKYPPIIIDGSTDSFYIDETWVAPTTPSDIPDTTSTKQQLVTNNKGEKVWTNLPFTETIRIDLTDATRIMPDVIQNYSGLTPAEMIQKGRSMAIYNLVFYREIRDHVGSQMGVVVDLIKDRGYKVFTNENGDYYLRVYFDNYAPIIIDATKENPIYLDPDYVAPEPIIPETTKPHQYLTTNENGEKVWEEKLGYLQTEQRELVALVEDAENYGAMLYAQFTPNEGDQCLVILNGVEYHGVCGPINMVAEIFMDPEENCPYDKIMINCSSYNLSGSSGVSGSIQIFTTSTLAHPIDNRLIDLDLPIVKGKGTNSAILNDGKALGGHFAEAEGILSTAMNQATAIGESSLAINNGTTKGGFSFAQGNYTIATGQNQAAFGRFNVEDTENTYALLVGNGTSSSARSNAHSLDWDGNAWFQGTIKVGGTSQDDEVAIEVATKPDIATLQSAIDALNGTGEGSVRDIVADAVATIVANAPEDFDTLKEVADWISNDTLGTADLLQRMTTAEEKIVELDIQADWNQTDENAKDFILNKPVPITDDEIDAICGGDLTLDITENALVDITTGIVYRIYVEDGKLNMKQVNESANTERLVFVDTSTDIIYKVYVENGKLHMTEVE